MSRPSSFTRPSASVVARHAAQRRQLFRVDHQHADYARVHRERLQRRCVDLPSAGKQSRPKMLSHNCVKVVQADLPGATPLVSLVSLAPSSNDAASTVGVLTITYADGAGVTADNLRNAINKERNLKMNLIIGRLKILLFVAALCVLQMRAISRCPRVQTTTFAVQLAKRRISFEVCIS